MKILPLMLLAGTTLVGGCMIPPPYYPQFSDASQNPPPQGPLLIPPATPAQELPPAANAKVVDKLTCYRQTKNGWLVFDGVTVTYGPAFVFNGTINPQKNIDGKTNAYTPELGRVILDAAAYACAKRARIKLPEPPMPPPARTSPDYKYNPAMPYVMDFRGSTRYVSGIQASSVWAL